MDGIVIKCKTNETLRLSELTEFQGELKKRDTTDVEKIITSIKKYGFSFPFFVWQHNAINHVLDGHGRILALRELEKRGEIIPVLPVVYVDCADEAEAKKKLLHLNSIHGRMTKESIIDFTLEIDIDFSELSLPSDIFTFDFNTADQEKTKIKLCDEFLIPPVSIIDSRKGYWQDRKRKWKSIGIQSELGRNDNMLKNLAVLAKKANNSNLPSESIFDPVLCEVIYSWFCTKNSTVLDPFAGGSVRGIVASFKNLQYTGFDIRPEQIESNEKQKNICSGNTYQPKWIISDSRNIDSVLPSNYEADLIFSCPPYADLEKYSDMDGDISNMPYDEFLTAYQQIIQKSCARLKENRFAVFVVGEVRNRKQNGAYYNFISDTISAFKAAGLTYYNEVIYLTQFASVPLTCANIMRKSRKISKVHQNILCFCKGNPVTAAQELGDINIAIEMLDGLAHES